MISNFCQYGTLTKLPILAQFDFSHLWAIWHFNRVLPILAQFDFIYIDLLKQHKIIFLLYTVSKKLLISFYSTMQVMYNNDAAYKS